MATVQDIFGDNWKDRYPNYRDIVDHFAEILYVESFGEWQGDMVFLVQDRDDADRIGFLVQGYGSCSGCDSLQAACDDESEMNDLISRMEAHISWHDSPADAIAHLESREQANPYYISEQDWPQCYENMLKILKNL